MKRGTRTDRCRPCPRHARRFGWVGSAALLLGCEPSQSRPYHDPPEPAAPRAAERPGASSRESALLEPLVADDWLIALSVPGFGDAQVAPPRGIRAPRPVLVALHGYGDRPDWQCGAWTGITKGAVFVLCPQGLKLQGSPGNFAFGGVDATEREVLAALESLRKRFAGYVAGEVVLVGFSLGAARAAHLAERNPSLFSRVALVEGGTKAWSPRASARFERGGGKRLLLVCSQLGCEAPLRALARRSRGPETEVRVEYLGPLGHTMGPTVTRKLVEPWQWLAHGLVPTATE